MNFWPLFFIAIAYTSTVCVLCWLWHRTAVELHKVRSDSAASLLRWVDIRDGLQDTIDETRSDRDTWQDIASAHFVTLQTIAGYMTRRPPRRRWLAIARRVARDATKAPLTLKR